MENYQPRNSQSIAQKEKEKNTMAREAMVTRTIRATKVSVVGSNIETAEPENKTFYLPGDFKDEKNLLYKVRKEFESDTYKIAAVVDSEVVTTLYGMKIDDFIKNALVLDPETRKPRTEAVPAE